MADSRDHDVVIPWQFALLGFLAFGALLAAAVLGFALFPDKAGMKRSDAAMIKSLSIPYLIAVTLLTPILLKTGYAKVRRWNNEASANVPPEAQALTNFGRVRTQTAEHGIGIGYFAAIGGAIGFIGTILVTGRPTAALVCLIPMIAGIRSIVHHSRRV